MENEKIFGILLQEDKVFNEIYLRRRTPGFFDLSKYSTYKFNGCFYHNYSPSLTTIFTFPGTYQRCTEYVRLCN